MKDFPFLRPMLSPALKVLGREQEVDHLLDTLYKARMRNICLVGPAGVGKTELVREVARLAKPLGWTFYSLDLASLVSDTTYRGELEEKFTEAFRSLARQDHVVLFCDEAHLLSSAGETGGRTTSLTVGNLLKPYLSDGQITLWGATTPTEYRESIALDPALARRLPAYTLNSVDDATLRIILANFAKKYGTKLTVSQIEEYATLPGVQPDAGLEALDNACAHERRMNELERIARELPGV